MRKTIVANDAKIFQNPFAKTAVQIFQLYRLPRGAKQKKIQNYVQEEASLFFFFLNFGRKFCQIFSQYGQIKSTKRKLNASICSTVRPKVSYTSSRYLRGLKKQNNLHTREILVNHTYHPKVHFRAMSQMSQGLEWKEKIFH